MLFETKLALFKHNKIDALLGRFHIIDGQGIWLIKNISVVAVTSMNGCRLLCNCHLVIYVQMSSLPAPEGAIRERFMHAVATIS